MCGTNMLNGTHCTFDLSLRPDRQDDAQRFLNYADRVIPELFQLLGVQLPHKPVLLRFAQREGAAYIPHGPIEIGSNVYPNDLGCITHEAVHLAQLPGLNLYQLYFYVFEGVADYYRIVFADDRKGDYFNDTKETLPAQFNPKDPYDCGSELIAHLRRRSGNADFVVSLNTALRSGRTQDVANFFINTFGHSHHDLLVQYQRDRSQYVGDDPASVNRYAYFTEM